MERAVLPSPLWNLGFKPKGESHTPQYDFSSKIILSDPNLDLGGIQYVVYSNPDPIDRIILLNTILSFKIQTTRTNLKFVAIKLSLKGTVSREKLIS